MSYSQYLRGKAIQTGCEWHLKIKVVASTLAAFPAEATFTAQVRTSPESPVLATLSTAAGSIVRIDANTLELILSASITEDWPAGNVVLDIIRTDLSQPIHLGFDMVIPVKRSITRL